MIKKTGKTMLSHPKNGFFAQIPLKKPSRRRNRLAGFPCKAFVILILDVMDNISNKKGKFQVYALTIKVTGIKH
jgi:hypothetical protein